MNAHPERLLLKMRRWLHVGEWSAGLLGLPKSKGTSSEPGLVMVQIDGFSKKEFQRALENDEVPFLKQLLDKEHYRLYPFYSGLPSSTPSVQGELFYGVPKGVPSFFYYDRVAHKPVQMYTGDDVQQSERWLASQGKGLLEGGSAYADIYTGGAQEPHFCAFNLGWNKIWKDVNPLNAVLLGLLHFWIFLRIKLLVAFELILACGDFFHGVSKGEHFTIEARFILLRAAICVLLRELVTLGAQVDTGRGLPIIHLNLLGFDELAHRRGPSSGAAHWSLRGIDESIARIYNSAIHSTRRHYDLWVYSDHGQEESIPYQAQYGRSLTEAIQEVYERLFADLPRKKMQPSLAIQTQGHRVHYLGGIFKYLFSAPTVKHNHHDELIIVAKGGTGHIYLEKKLTVEQIDAFAKEMVTSAHVPLVFAKEEEDKALAWNANGCYILPQQAAEVLGANHPYLAQVAEDLVKICHHPKAGDLMISGLKIDGKCDNFVFEHGDHGGPGKDETDAFALVPAEVKILSKGRDFIVTQDLRRCALHLLGKSESLPAQPKTADVPTAQKTIRIMTYNVHSCVGMDGKVSAERIARVISRYEPDIIALQELDLSRPHSGVEDQPHIIARHLQMLYHFHPTIQIKEQQYGNAILSRFPLQIKKTGLLPRLSYGKVLEPRGALWAEIDIQGRKIQFINTHLSIFHPEALKQVKALTSQEWLFHPQCEGPVVLCGDFNALPTSPVYKNVKRILRDAQEEVLNHRPQATWLSRYPVGRIDHAFVNSHIHVVKVLVPKNDLNKMVSDHLPLIVDINYY